MEISTKKFANFLLISGMAAFFVAAILNIGSQMPIKADGTMGGCLFNGQAELCTMGFGQHFAQWQNMFTATPSKTMTLSLVLAVIGLFILASAFLKRHLIWAVERMAALQKLYLIHQRSLSLFNPLREVFSQGILNPEIYNSAVI